MIKHIFQITLWIIVISISARLSFDIPLTEINTTGQTLSILTMAIVARPRVAIPAIIIYVILGITGLPIFSDGNNGWSYFIGPTLGYIVGFILSVVFITTIYWNNKEHEWAQGWMSILILHLLGSFIILFCGVLRLSLIKPFIDAMITGFTPFILSAIIKSLLGVVLVAGVHKYNRSEISISD